MGKILYHNEGVVASFPYKFEIEETPDGPKGTVTAYLYKDVNIPDDPSQLKEKLSQLYSQEDSGYFIEGTDIVYRSWRIIPADVKNDRAAEVNVRRHFIEDYLEDEHDLADLIVPLGGKTLKTEFVGQEF